MERSFIRSLKIDGTHPARRWTDEILAGALYAIKENGEPVNSGYLEIHHKNLHSAIVNHLGWRRAVILAGFDPFLESARNFGSRKKYVQRKSTS